MWWQPENEQEIRTRNQVDRLERLLIEWVPPAKLVYGVGTLTWRDRLAPLLVVDRSLDPRRGNRERVGGAAFSGPFLSRAVYDLVGPLWPLSYQERPHSLRP